MRGLMMATPLLISSIITHAARHHGAAEIVSRTVEGPYHHYTYRDAERRIKQLANALVALGLAPGDRVATLAWNGYRHLELFHAISSLGAVCHTINPRLFKRQIECDGAFAANAAANDAMPWAVPAPVRTNRFGARIPPSFNNGDQQVK